MQIIEITDQRELNFLFAELNMADTDDIHTVRVSIQNGQVMFKVNSGVWTPSLGHVYGQTGDRANAEL